MRLKIDLYRRLARVATEQELDDLAAELIDRFGPHPPTVQRLLRRMRLRLLAQQWQVDSIHLEDGYAVLTYLNRPRIEELAALRKKRLRIVDERSAYVPLPKTELEPDGLVELLESMLLPS